VLLEENTSEVRVRPVDPRIPAKTYLSIKLAALTSLTGVLYLSLNSCKKLYDIVIQDLIVEVFLDRGV
jgi:hypothetical protein